MAAARPGRARRHDPQRRARIARAAVEVVAAHGVEGLTHRAVAAAADVPLGSTTYHFASRDDLLAAALDLANSVWIGQFETWAAALPPGADTAEALAGLLCQWAGEHRDRTVVEYELYVAALRRPALRPVVERWAETAGALLGRVTGDAKTARALLACVDGLLLQALLADRPPRTEEVAEVLRRVLR